eukprot:15065902-Alexandrium_andersonii.AAC.1
MGDAQPKQLQMQLRSVPWLPVDLISHDQCSSVPGRRSACKELTLLRLTRHAFASGAFIAEERTAT